MNAPFQLFNNNTAQPLPMLHSRNLFAMGREIRILHEGEEYRLRLTRNNRLILTKYPLSIEFKPSSLSFNEPVDQ